LGKEKSFKEKVEEWWEDSKLRCIYGKVEDAFYDIKRGIKNLIVWFPTIWKDRDWDHYYLYVIMKKKLERMEYLQRTYGHHVDNEKTADQIKICKLILGRLIEDDYLFNATKYHDEKWGELRLITKPIPETQVCFVEVETTKPLTEKEKIQERKERSAAFKHGENMRKQDLDMLFNIMKKHVEGWWD